MGQLERDYDALLNEHFDLSDHDTLHLINNLNEAGQNQLLINLTDKLYQKIVEKVDDIDFGTIPKSAGDITKVENYESMVECLNIIREIVKQYHQKEEPVDTILTAITNIKDRKHLFSKCFAMNVELGMILYNSMVYACIKSVSFMIATSIEFIKSPTDDAWECSMDKVAYQKTANNMLYNDLRKFNASCKSGEIDRVLNGITGAVTKKMTGAAIGTAILGAAVIIPLAKTILPMIQDLVYLFYYSSQSISDYWSVQADLVQMNQSTILYRNDIPDEKKDEIIKKQNKAIDVMRKVSNAFAIDMKTSERNATRAEDNDKRKYTVKPKTLNNVDTVGDLEDAFDSSSPLF